MPGTTRACLVVLVVALAFLIMECAAAGTAGGQRRRQVQSLLKRLNKPPLASIKSPDEDIIDCVHINKQPAFDHPFLKNHTIQMRPSYHPAGGLYDESKIETQPISQLWHQNGKCPENTVPIRRTKEEEVLRASSIKRYGKKRPRSIPKLVSVDDPDASATIGHLHAVASASGDNNYYGTKTTINLWQPTIESGNGFSLAQLWITAGSYEGNDLNTIEAGWQVYPGRYHDSNTRLFIYWTRDAYHQTGCYNLGCPGFIQTNNQIAIGGSISPVSIYGGSQQDIDISIWKDPKGGNWWLQVGSDILGYWPPSIFSYLADSASSVEWGGEVYSLDASQASSTQMGSGHFPEEGFCKSSYIKNIQVVDSSNTLKSPDSVRLIAERPSCYDVQNGTSSDWGTYIYHGGPGRSPNCQ